MDAPREYSSDDITRLGTGLNDLGSILALPAVWAGAEPSQIVSTLVDTLLEILHLSFVFVRLTRSTHRWAMRHRTQYNSQR